ncbi:7TM diverse intracellular signaling domain-containing protein [Flavobacterium sp.]|uniref:7TM diverse intracellular signaling domain-containing protein n=1 Tax=Flavobacterium sp. TaxID=239 RepID=UPI003D12ABA2
MRKILVQLLGFIFMLFFMVCQSQTVKNGKDNAVNIPASAVHYDKTVQLKGNWDFYFKQYGTSKQFLKSQSKENVAIPGGWRGNYYLPNTHSAKGYGTFYKKISFDKIPSDSVGILFPDINAAGEIWINGDFVTEKGNFSLKENKNLSLIEPILLPLPKVKEIELFIPISHYNHRMGGGMLQAPIIGNYFHLQQQLKKDLIYESISTVIVLIIVIFSLLKFFFITRKRTYLYFGLMCSMAMLRQIAIGSGLLTILFGEVDFVWVQTFRYIGFYLGTGFGALYFYELFPNFVKRSRVRFVFIASVVVSVFAIVANKFYASYGTILFQIIGLLTTVLVFVRIQVFLVKKNDEVSRFTIISLGVFLLTVINDILYTQMLLPTRHLQHIGFLLFALIQLYVLMLYYKNQMYQIENLSKTIEEKDKVIEFKDRDIDYLALHHRDKMQSKKEIIEELTNLLKNADVNQLAELKKTIQEYKREILIEEHASNAVIDADLVRSEFVDKLQTQFPMLTKSEVEICLLIRLNLSTKEIALKRKATDASIKVAKHRIRAKVGVKSTQELEKLLVSL